MTNTAAAFDNVAIGYQTALGTGAFGRNVAIGSTAGRSLDAATDNVLIGQTAGSGLQSGVNNVIVGRAAGSNGLVENRMSIVGANACTQCSVGDNSSIGYQSLFNTTSGINNTALGQYSQYSNLVGSWNTSAGQYSQWGTNAGTASHYQNTSFGAYSLYQIRASANRNIALGYKAVIDSITGSDNIAIGDSIDLPSRTASNQGTIGNVIYIIGGMGHSTTVGTGRVGIGVNAPDASAQLDLTSTTKGFLVPRMTQTQRDAIVSPATGLQIYDITNAGFYWYNGAAWVPLSSAGGTGTDNANAGSFYRLVIPSSQAIKTIANGLYMLVDSTTNTNAITVKIDTASMFPVIRGTLPPAGALTIGTAITSGNAYRALFEGSGNTLSELSGYSFDGVRRLSIPDIGMYKIGTNVGLYMPNQTSFPNSMFIGDSIINMAAGASLNLVVGTNAGKAITTAVSNVFIGPRSGQATTSATNSVAVGDASLFGQTNTATNNTAVGKSAMQGTTTASNNTAVGASALLNNVTGAQNIAIGTTALNANTASDNVGVGFQAVYQNASGTNNTGVGSGVFTGTGGNNFSTNTGLGYFVGHSVTTGSSNTGVGASALLNITSGGSNTALGASSAAGITTGGNNLILGDNIGTLAAAQSNTTVIGNNGIRSVWINGNRNAIIGGSITNTDTAARGATVTVNGTFKIETVGAAASTSKDSALVIENGLVKYVRDDATLSVNTTDVGNVGIGEDDLMTYTVPAAQLSTANDRIEFEGVYNFTGANSKTLKLYFGAQLLTQVGAGITTAFITIKGTIFRTGAATQKANITMVSSSATYQYNVDISTPAETLSGTVVLKSTGTGTADNDIVQKSFVVNFKPAP
jgi:hypothetical protein